MWSVRSEETRLMTTESSMREAAGRAFITAFLLTGNAGSAEAAVLKSIGFMNCVDASGEELFQGTVSAKIETDELPGPRQPEPGSAFEMLPVELQRVLQLPRRIRQCFVLRVLVGLSREVCARLLSFDGRQVDLGACVAMSELYALRKAGAIAPRRIESSRNGIASVLAET